MAHVKNRLPWDHLTVKQVDEVRQRLREWWPKNPESREYKQMINALAGYGQISTRALSMFKNNVYPRDNRAIAWNLARFFGVKIPGKED